MDFDTRTQQELFDEIVSGLIAQGKPSLNEFWQCSYRGKDGTKCAAGMIVPDASYDLSMENHFFGTTMYGVQNFPRPMLSFIEQLQSAHDHAFTNAMPGSERAKITDAEWLEAFLLQSKYVAQRYHLEWKYDW